LQASDANKAFNAHCGYGSQRLQSAVHADLDRRFRLAGAGGRRGHGQALQLFSYHSSRDLADVLMHLAAIRRGVHVGYTSVTNTSMVANGPNDFERTTPTAWR
jgi:hypothetical protein